MKAKVIIENGETTIFLTPENIFETEIVEKVHARGKGYSLHVSTNAEYKFGDYVNHRFEISIKEIR